jgi:multiple sugar transport system permease protein
MQHIVADGRRAGRSARSALARRFSAAGLFWHVILLVGGIFMVVPFGWMLSTSLKSDSEAFQFPPTILPQHWLFSNYATAWNFAPFGRFYLNTFVMSATVTAGQILTCSLAAYAFARLRFPGREVIFYLFLSTMMIPWQVTMIPAFLVINWLGWVNTYQAVIVPGLASAFGIFLLRQFFLTIPHELDDAATIDGTGRFGILFRIILPLSGPAIAALSIFTFMAMWNNFLWPLIVENSTDMMPVTVGLSVFQGEYNAQWNLMMAAAVTATIPVLIVYVLAQRYFIRGIALTGLKE